MLLIVPTHEKLIAAIIRQACADATGARKTTLRKAEDRALAAGAGAWLDEFVPRWRHLPALQRTPREAPHAREDTPCTPFCEKGRA
jgi:hypothetical protein